MFGHVGDGNFHALLLFDPADPAEFAACKDLSLRMGRRAMDMGGTCTGEHGVGTGKRHLLAEMVGSPGIAAHKAIKAALDPKGIMNPGKVV